LAVDEEADHVSGRAYTGGSAYQNVARRIECGGAPSATVIGKILTDICYKFAPNYSDKL
jgi:hypothetical protein